MMGERRSDRLWVPPSWIVADNNKLTNDQVGEDDTESAAKRQRVSVDSPRKGSFSSRRKQKTDPNTLCLDNEQHTSNGQDFGLNFGTTTLLSSFPQQQSPPAIEDTLTPSTTGVPSNSDTSSVITTTVTPHTANTSQNSILPEPNNSTLATTAHNPSTVLYQLEPSSTHVPPSLQNSVPAQPNPNPNTPILSSISMTQSSSLNQAPNPITPVLGNTPSTSTPSSLRLSATIETESKPPSSNKSEKSKKDPLYRHLEGIVRKYEGSETASKFKISAIATDTKRAEYTEFLSEYFKAKQLDKDKKKELRSRRKAHPSNFHEEIRQMMHGFGDEPDANTESAKFIELLVKKFLTQVITSVKDVLPTSVKTPKINAEVLSVALLPDVKRVHRIQQGIQLLIQRRRLRHAEETSAGSDSVADSGGGEFENLTVEALDTLTTEAQVHGTNSTTHTHKTKLAEDEAPSALFDTPYWTELLRAAAIAGERDKLERHRLKDKLSQQVPADGFAYFTQCTNASFTKPFQKKFIEFLQAHCGLQEDMVMTTKVVEMVGLLAHDFVMEVVLGALKYRDEAKGSNAIEPFHIASFLSSFSIKI